MLAYHNDPTVKAKYEVRFAAHRAADDVIQGIGFKNGRGCFIGCTLDAYEHRRFPVELGWPEWLAHLADTIFEGLPASEAPQFGTDLLAAVPIGADLERAKHPFLLGLLDRRLAALPDDDKTQVRAAVTAVRDLCQRPESVTPGEWEAAARAAARSAAAAARESVV